MNMYILLYQKSFDDLKDFPNISLSEENKNLEAVDVFGKMIEKFKIPRPDLLKNPIEFYINFFKSCLPKLSKDEETDIYFFQDIINVFEKSKKLLDKDNQEQEFSKFLNQIKDFIAKFSIKDIMNLISNENIDKLDIEKIKEVINVIWGPIVTNENLDDKYKLDMYNRVLELINKVIELDSNQEENLEKRMVYIQFLKAVNLVKKEEEKSNTILNSIIQKHINSSNETVLVIVAESYLLKESLEKDNKFKIKILDEMIIKFKNNEKLDIRRSVAKAMLIKSTCLEDKRQLYNDIIEEYDKDEHEEIRCVVAISKFAIASLEKENKEIYNHIVEKYNEDNHRSTRFLIASIKAYRAQEIEKKEEQIQAYNDVIEEYDKSEDLEIQVIVARTKVNKAMDLENKEENIKIYNEIIKSYKDYEEDKRIKSLVILAKLNKVEYLEHEEKINAYNEIIEEYKNDDYEDIRYMVAACYESIGFQQYKNNNKNEAVLNFYNSYLYNKENGINLGYMIRRNEISDEKFPLVEELLSTGVEKNDNLALVNYALCFALGFQVKEDWDYANQLVNRIDDTKKIIEWWLYELDDVVEKNLVIGWIVRNGLIEDPEGLDFTERFNIVKQSGIYIPEFMFHKDDGKNVANNMG